MKLHLVSLPHTQVSSGFCGCAYTAKVLKFCKMMKDRAEIILYAPDGPDVFGAESVKCLTSATRQKIFGPDDPNRIPEWPTHEQTAQFNRNVIKELGERATDADLVLLSGGLTHKPIMDALPGLLYCEPFCGYEGIATDYVAFESRSHRNTVYSKRAMDGRWYDTVIPNYFDQSEFAPEVKSKPGEYLLYLGRLVSRKGPHVASDIARASGMPLYVAGPGGRQVGADIVCGELTIKDAKYLGPVGVAERATLLKDAHALLAPTIYVEPFGGVAVEAMMAGTPAITTDWGAFPETVQQGVTGFRVNSLKEAVAAVEACGRLEPRNIRYEALLSYALEAVAPQFHMWFERILDLRRGGGWYKL